MKKRDDGYFINHGKDFRLKPTFAEEIDRRDSEGSDKNWETVHVSRLPRGLGIKNLRVSTLQYIFPKDKRPPMDEVAL